MMHGKISTKNTHFGGGGVEQKQLYVRTFLFMFKFNSDNYNQITNVPITLNNILSVS
jgi:hypothetical protein